MPFDEVDDLDLALRFVGIAIPFKHEALDIIRFAHRRLCVGLALTAA